MIKSIKLGVERAQYNKSRFPEKYTDKNKMGLYSQEEKQAALAGAFNFGSNVWLDLSPFDENGQKLEKEAVAALGLGFKPNWRVVFTPEGGGASQESTVLGTGTGVAITGIDEVLGVGGESADESLGYHIRFHLGGEGTYEFTVSLMADGRELVASRILKAS